LIAVRIYEGRRKSFYEGPEPGTRSSHSTERRHAFNAKKHQIIEGKGVSHNASRNTCFKHLNDIGVPTQLQSSGSTSARAVDREVETFRSKACAQRRGRFARDAASASTKYAAAALAIGSIPDDHSPSVVSEEHITAFGWATPHEIDDIMALAIRRHDFLSVLSSASASFSATSR